MNAHPMLYAEICAKGMGEEGVDWGWEGGVVGGGGGAY